MYIMGRIITHHVLPNMVMPANTTDLGLFFVVFFMNGEVVKTRH